MSFLESMRKGADSTGMQVVLALVLVSFIGWTGTPNGDSTRVVASVNGTRIQSTDLERSVRDRLRNEELRRQRSLSQDERVALAEEVEQALIEDELVKQAAKQIGLQVSDTEIASYIVDSPAFQDRDGAYSAEMHDRYLKRTQFTRDDYNERIRNQLLLRKMRTLVLLGATVSDATVRDYWVEANTQVTLDLVRVRPAVFDDDVVIDEPQRALFLTEHAARVQEAYDKDYDRLYNHPEQVRLLVVRMAVVEGGTTEADLMPRMNGLRSEIEAGADFAALAARWSEDASALQGGEMGLRPVVQLPLEVADAIRELQPGQLSRLVTTASELRFFRLEERIAASVDSLETVKPAIVDRLIRADKVPAMAATWAESQLLARWVQEKVPPADLLTTQGLAVQPVGPMPAAVERGRLGLPSALLRAARTAVVGSVLPEVYEDRGDLFVAALTVRDEPELAEFEVAKVDLREQVLQARREAYYVDWVASLRASAVIE